MKKTALTIICILISFLSLFAISKLQAEQSGPLDQLSLLERVLLNSPGDKGTSSWSAGGSDWLLSESISPAKFNQRKPSISPLKNGNWLTVWTDSRLGPEKIFARIIDSTGFPVASDRLLHGSPTGADYTNARTYVDTTGMIYVGFRDGTNGLVYLSRLNQDLSEDIAPYVINDTTFNSFSGSFDLAVYPDGQAVVVWENYSGLSTTIEMSIVDSVGNVLLMPTTVNSGGGSFSRFDPSVGVNPAGDFLVAWNDTRNLVNDVYLRLFNSAGTPYGLDENVTGAPDNAMSQTKPAVCYSAVDDFVIGFKDSRGAGQIFAQRYSRAVGLVGGNVLVSDSLTSSANSNPDLVVRPDDQVSACWSTSIPGSNIFYRSFDPGLLAVSPIVTADSLDVAQEFYPVITVRDSLFAFCWEQVRDNDPNIAFGLFDTSGVAILTSEYIVNADLIGAPSINPEIVVKYDGAEHALVVFEDSRSGSSDIYLQAFDREGTLIGTNQKLVEDITNAYQGVPDIALSENKSLTVWLDSRVVSFVPGLRVFGRYSNLSGGLIGNEIMISSGGSNTVSGQPRVAMTRLGKGLVAWLDLRVSPSQVRVYGQWLTSDGALIGSEFEISNASDSNVTDLHIAIDSLDRFYLIWRDNGKDTATIEIQWYESDGTAGTKFSFRSPVDSIRIDKMAAAVNDSGDVHLFYVGVGDERHLYLTVLDNSGGQIMAPIIVDDSPLSFASDPEMAVGDNNYIVTVWIDRRQGSRQLYNQIYNDAFGLIGANNPVSGSTPESMESPSVIAARGRAWFSWSEPDVNGLNIYANNLVFLPTDVKDDKEQSLPVSISLSQNYPNPFNPTTIISFTLDKKQQVSLSLFNVLGRKVRDLVTDELIAGTHEYEWDGKDESGTTVASGIYFYRLSTDHESMSRKMILLK